MQALRVHEFGNPARMSLDDLPDPQPAAGQVVVKVEAAGVNPVDSYVAAGTYAIKPDLPYIPGMDAAGVIESIGEGVTQWNEGDRVIVCGTTAGRLRGAFATHCVCDAAHLWPLPSALTFAQGAGINVPYVTAFRALFDVGRAKRGDRVLIHGATGGVGLAALQIARGHGLFTIATGGSEEGRELLKKQGADLILDHTAGDHLDVLKDEPPTLILEMLANVNLDRDMAAVADHGRIVVIGNRGETTINPRHLMGKQATVTGLTYWTDGDSAIRRAMDAIVQGIEAGDVRPVVQAEIDLEKAQEAFDLVLTGKSAGKVVVLP